MGLSSWLSSKESICNAGATGDSGWIPRLGRSPQDGNGNPLQYSCLENPMARGVWWATVHGVAKSRTRLSNLTFNFQLNPLVSPGRCALRLYDRPGVWLST